MAADLPDGASLSMHELRQACASKLDIVVPSRYRLPGCTKQVAVPKKDFVMIV